MGQVVLLFLFSDSDEKELQPPPDDIADKVGGGDQVYASHIELEEAVFQAGFTELCLMPCGIFSASASQM